MNRTMLAVLDAVADGNDVVMVVASASATDSIARIRASDGGCLLIAIPADIAPVERAMLRAAIGALAAERAPDTRICGLDIAAGAGELDVIAAARFLAGARSSTGQILDVSA